MGIKCVYFSYQPLFNVDDVKSSGMQFSMLYIMSLYFYTISLIE